MARSAHFAAVFLTAAAMIYAVDSDAGGYGSITDYLNGIYGIDGNAGLTAFPILSIPAGGRSEGMAGAFSAVADDVSFIEWNPAGSSMLNTSELAFFHNNWIADAKIEAVSYAARFNNLGIGVNGKWLYLPFTQYGYFGDRLSKGYYSEAAAALNCSYNFFPGYYFGGVSFGVNVKGALRSVPDYDSGEKGEVTPGSGRAQSAAALMADAGFLTRVNLFKFYNSRERNMSFALVARNLGPPALGEALPSVIIAGISYRPLRPLLMSFDFSVPVNMADVRRSESPYWAAGLSVTATDFLSMRAGLLMKAGNIRATLGSEVGLQHLSLDINYTLDLLTQIQPLNRVALGVRFNLGDNGAKAKSDLVDEYYLAGLNAYSDARDEEARALFEKALALNPRFEPAIEALKSLDEYQKLNERITGIQTIEY